MTTIEPQLWATDAAAAIAFYREAFGAAVLHHVGFGDEVVAQLEVDGARFWVSNSGPGRHAPDVLQGATGRLLLVVEDPERVVAAAVGAGARETMAVGDEHGWRLGRIVDPAGHEWEIGHPAGVWPPTLD